MTIITLALVNFCVLRAGKGWVPAIFVLVEAEEREQEIFVTILCINQNFHFIAVEI